MHGSVFESELKVLELLWQSGQLTAIELAEQLKEQVGWSKTTTYTVIKKCVEKGLLEREKGESGNYLCTPMISREDVQNEQVDQLIERLYNGEADRLVASIVGRQRLSPQQIKRMIAMLTDDE